MKPRVLVFDDEAVFIQIIKHVLKKRDIEVYGELNCNKIKEVVSDIKPDLILMDNKIPPLGGVKATQSLKSDEELKHIHVIYFSAHDRIAELAKEAGADGYFAKPFDIHELDQFIMRKIKTA